MRYIIIILLTSCTLVSINAQSVDKIAVPSLDQIVSMPSSPEAAAFAKYGSTAVSFHSGAPNISIPLAGLKGRSMSVPISLTYDASGVKVAQVASEVGLNWNLNVGGAVTRIVKGLPDDHIKDPDNNATIATYVPFYSTAKLGASTKTAKELYDYYIANNIFAGGLKDYVYDLEHFFNAYEQRDVETQPDVYSFSVMGLSGTLFIDYSGSSPVAHCIEHPELKVEVSTTQAALSLGGSKVIDGWTITDTQGNKFEFNEVEITHHRDEDEYDRERVYNSAWFVSKITSTNSVDVIDFEYSTPSTWTPSENLSGYGDSMRDATSFIAIACPDPNDVVTTGGTSYRLWQSQLTGIKINLKTRATFTRASRTDLTNGRQRVDKITMFDAKGDQTEVIDFDNDQYFGSGNYYDKRLKLDGVSFLGANSAYLNDANQRKDYTFTYYNVSSVPGRDSKDQDYWGFFNYKSNSYLIPDDTRYGTSTKTGDRNPNHDEAISGTLQKITYPTGGYTEYFFQPHRMPIGESPFKGGSDTHMEQVLYGFVTYAGVGDNGTANTALYNSCNSEVDGTNQLPTSHESSPFTITQTDLYNLEVINNKNAQNITDPFTALFVYEGAAKTECQLLSNITASNILYYRSDAFAITEDVFLTLEAGKTYRIKIISNSDDVSLRVYRNEATTTPTNIPMNQGKIGGIRLYKMVDKPSATETAITKYYYYDDLLKSLVDVPANNLTNGNVCITGTDICSDPDDFMAVEQPSQNPVFPTLNDDFFKNSTASSGILQVPLLFESASPSSRLDGSSGKCSYVNRQASNLYRSMGNIMTYSTVTEVVWKDATAGGYNGFTVYDFENTFVGGSTPTVLGQKRNGKPKMERVYNNAWELQQQKEYTYKTVGFSGLKGLVVTPDDFGEYDLKSSSAILATVTPNYVDNNGTPCSPSLDLTCIRPGGTTNPTQNIYKMSYYGVSEYWIYPETEVVTIMDGSTDLTSTTNYYYKDVTTTGNEGQYQLDYTEVTDSRGDIYKTDYTYPQDYSPLSGETFHTTLEAAHRMSEVIVKETFKTNSLETVSIAKQKTSYKSFALSGLHPETISIAYDGNTLEPRIVYKTYDHGQPSLVEKDGELGIGYVWGYDYTLPIAQVSNVTFGDAFAYTSFELETAGGSGWNYSGLGNAASGLPSGDRHFDLTSGNVAKYGLSVNEVYTLSFWAKDGTPTITGSPTLTSIATINGWTFYKTEVSGTTSVTLSGSAKLDELRLYPRKSQMTTFTYDPSWGMTTQTGPNGLATHFEYDDYGRLKLVTDRDGNVLKLNEYLYKQDKANTSK